jgi:hypothetical protein
MSAKRPAKKATRIAAEERLKRAELKHLRLVDEAGMQLEKIRSALVLLVAAAGSGDPAAFDLSERDVQSSLCEAARHVLSEVVALGDVHQGLHDAMSEIGGLR